MSRRPTAQLKIELTSRLATPLCWVARATWRTRTTWHPEAQALFASQKPAILALWHGQMFSLLAAAQRHPLAVLISPSNDGELIARTVQPLGFRYFIRGSFKRGGEGAARDIIRLFRKEGVPLAFTVDGPRGPRHVVKPGVLRLAAMAQVPIIPLKAQAHWHLWQFKSAWDHFEAPQFFTRIYLNYGQPLWVPKTVSQDDRLLATYLEQLQQALLRQEDL
jgi:lysophospholipid acyltransferase (LPLAT)-like uncharacterized protein